MKLSLGDNGNEISRSINLARRLPEAFGAVESARRVERDGAGRRPASENPAELIAELEAVARELGLLIKRINRTNPVKLFEGERTVSDVLAERDVLKEVERINPQRIVFDSLSEMRLLAHDPLRYRRQILALKQYFIGRECTVMLLDD